MLITRVDVPIVFDNIPLLILIALGIIILPAIFTLILAIIANRKAAAGTTSYLKPFLSSIGGGLVGAVILGTIAYAAVPFFYERQAFHEVAEYYDVEFVRSGQRLPVLVYEGDTVENPTPMGIQTTKGANIYDCEVYAQDTSSKLEAANLQYVLYCGNPLAEYRPGMSLSSHR